MANVNNQTTLLNPDTMVTLYVLDTTVIGGDTIFRFTRASDNLSIVEYDNNPYQPIDIAADGFRWDGQGPFPKPKLRIVNTGGLITGALITFGDLVGAKFYRIRTFAKYLDKINGVVNAGADPTATFPIEEYIVNQRTAQTKIYVEWTLTSSLDLLDVQLPRRQVLRDSCTHRYRIWNPDTSSFDYTDVTCPYVASTYYRDDDSTTASPSEDSCSRLLTGCKKRFGENAVLPTRSFPGVSRIRP